MKPAAVLSSYRYGMADPTTRLDGQHFWRATLTPAGPGTVHIAGDRAEAWGPGADWLLERVPAMTGALDPGHVFVEGHAVLIAAQRDHPGLRFGASGTLYHELLPTVLGQRITAGEAFRQWHLLTKRLGRRAPGPADLLLPPAPDDLAQPTWWFHPLGIEAKRASALRHVARHADKLFGWGTLPPSEAAAKLALLPGVGPWTIGSVMATAFGDPDAVAVGDYHLKNVVVHALTGRARGTDEEMLVLLQPYAGQRGRVVQLLMRASRPPKFGPRQRILPMNRW